ncbi:MAG: glycosyltransferase family 39 protein [Candidatus Kapabacteria bacterium]|nr:glycosyltransferase family 39 protein [Candidatus Kapabacteria bacterium]
MDIIKKYKYQILIIIATSLFFLPFLGEVHLFDWDEINFAEAAREMLASGDYTSVRIDYQIFYEKPPLFIWIQAASMAIFGVNEFAARLPNVIVGIFTFLFIFSIGKKLVNNIFGLLWILAYSGSLLPQLYFRTGIIDPLFNLFIFIGIYFLYSYYLDYKFKNLLSSSLLISLAILTKGPVALLIVSIVWIVFYFLKRKTIKFTYWQFPLFTILSILPFLIWNLAVMIKTGNIVINDFIQYNIRLLSTEDAGHGGPFYYHFIVILIGCFPASIVAIRGYFGLTESNPKLKIFESWNFILFLTVLVIFSIVNTKIIHYSSLCYLPLTFFAARALNELYLNKIKLYRYQVILIGLIGLIISLAFTLIPLIFINKEYFLPKITDKFIFEILKADVHWSGFEFIFGIILTLTLTFTIIQIIKGHHFKPLLLLFSISGLTIFFILITITPKIEQYLQSTSIEFYKSLQQQDVFINTDFKSYAPYFYQQKPIHLSASGLGISQDNYNSLIKSGNPGKPVYMIFSIKEIKKAKNVPNSSIVAIKNGFIFVRRF